MSKGIKFAVVGFERSGKTRLISQIKDVLVVSTDNKAFTGKVPHYRYSEYNGMDDFTATLNEKVETYIEKMGNTPKTIVIDSITHLTNNMEKYCNEKFRGFDVYKNLGKDILELNAFLESITEAGINVIFTAHTQYDPDTMTYKIHSSGSFGKNGSWLSVVDEAIYIELKGSKRIVHFKTPKFPCRTLHDELPDHIEIDKFDINKHIAMLEKSNGETEEWSL